MSKIYYPYPANDGEHKNDIITKSGKTTKFDSIGYSDFTIHKDEARKQRYIDRHTKNEYKYWNKSACFIACEVIRLPAWGIFTVASDYFKSISSALGFTRGRLRSDVLR